MVPLEEGEQSYSSWGFVLLSAVLEAAFTIDQRLATVRAALET
jgi:hypothetical protein